MSANPPLSIASLTTPVAVGYVPLGMVFGLLFVQAGGAAWLAVASSLLVYAGAAQFMMVPMLAAGMPVGSIVLATLVINLRHVFYGLSLLENMPAARWRRWYVIYALTDETWSVLTALPEKQRADHMTVLSALNQLWWVGGTLAGALIGARAGLDMNGLDFALAALFAVLAAEQWRSRRDPVPVWVALGSYAAAAWLLPDHALTAAIAACVLGAFLRSDARLAEGRP